MALSVLTPTFRRPEGFLRAARSVLSQDDTVRIVGLDNAPEHSAREVFSKFAAEAGARFVSGHEPRAGVAHARNAALSLADSDLIAWLDDDEEAPPGWLAALQRVAAQTDADVVFGPVCAQTPDHPQQAYFEALYSRIGPAHSGPLAHPFGIGNSLMRRAALPHPAPFDLATNETGGEDDRLFSIMQKRGARLAWAHDARVLEHVEANRLTFAHAMKRAFAYGQGPCETAFAKRDYAEIVRHMGVGAAQAIVFGAAAGAAHALKAANAMTLSDRAARGAGKVFWFRPQKFYGEAA